MSRSRSATLQYAPLAATLAVVGVLLALAFFVSSSFADHPGPPSGNGVQPVFVAGNPSCSDFTDDPDVIEFKVQPVTSGTHTDGTLTVDLDVYNTDPDIGPAFDWTSNFPVALVFVKGGDNGNLYEYDPPETEDTFLHSPVNHANNKFFGLSHVSFCYFERDIPQVELQVDKTAETTFTRTWEWDIEKSVDPETWDLFTGDDGTSEYTVTITKTGFTDSDWAVSGTITITNPAINSEDAVVESVTDEISPDIPADVDCGVTFPHELAPGDSLICTYSADLPDGSDRLNTATVTTSGEVPGDEAFADVDFGDPTTEVNDEINVEDTFAGDLGTFSDSDTVTYQRTFECDDDEGLHENTAEIVETGQSDDADVTVNCYELDVTKNANTSLTRTWTWTIEKTADQTDLVLSEGQLFEVNYEITVDATFADSDHAVSGDIWIDNPHPTRDAELTDVSDIVSPDIDADVDCPSLTVPASDSLHCTYSADLPDADLRTNTATATLQNYSFDSEGVGTPSGTTDFDGQADVDFASATINEVDECVDVSDTNVGFLGTVCAGDAPATFNYSLWFGAHPDADVVLECEENTHTNIADFETNDTGTTGEDDWTVDAEVACPQGCTLTPGYWKTHSIFGPAPYDDTWALLPNEENTLFFLSGQTYYEVLWTPPAGGNAYYILAHAYIAAELNQLNGASIPPDVLDAFDDATDLFNTYTPDEVAEMRGKNGKDTRAQFIELAGILDGYNNGLTGPGHCSE